MSIRQIDAGTLTSVSAAPATGELPSGPSPVVAYEFDAPLHRFAKPIKISLLYPDVDALQGQVDGTNIKEDSLKVFWWDGYEWRLMGGVVNPEFNTVTTLTNHFSLFALFPASHLSSAAFRPNEKIITPNSDGQHDVAVFGGLSGDFKLEIYDVTGKRVRSISQMPEWDGRDDDGKIVENGVYVYQYKPSNTSEFISGMIGVAQ